MEPNLAENIYIRSSIKFLHFDGDPVLLIIRGELVGDKCGLLLGLAVEYTTPTK
jgi:hypothetical protein